MLWLGLLGLGLGGQAMGVVGDWGQGEGFKGQLGSYI